MRDVPDTDDEELEVLRDLQDLKELVAEKEKEAREDNRIMESL